MAYSFAWDETYPPDSELANLLAQNQRRIEQNIRERMDDVFTDPSGTWAASGPANPVVPSALLKGNFTGKVISFHHSAFMPDPMWQTVSGIFGGGSQYNAVTRTEAYAQVNGSTGSGPPPCTLYCPVVLPNLPSGVTITSVTFTIDLINTSNVITLKVGYVNLQTGVVVILNSANAPSVVGLNQVTLSAGSLPFSTLIGGGTVPLVFLEAAFTIANFQLNGGRMYGASVTYNAADSRNTV